MTTSPWSPERDAELRRLVAEGYSYSEIASRLAVTRSAAIDRAHRLGLVHPGLPPEAKAYPRPLSARDGGCRFPLWRDDERPTHEYCSAPTPVGSSYCGQHKAVVWVKTPKPTGKPFKLMGMGPS